MSSVTKPERRAAPQRKTPPCKTPAAPTPSAVSAQARRQAAAILEVLAGVRRPVEAAQVLETSLPRYYQLERRALAGLLAACEPVPRGPGINVSRRINTLERENRRLQRQCDRQQALVRVAERSLGLALPTARQSLTKGSGLTKGSEDKPSVSGAKRRRAHRPTVRALKAARALRAEALATAVEEVKVVEMTAPVMEGG